MGRALLAALVASVMAFSGCLVETGGSSDAKSGPSSSNNTGAGSGGRGEVMINGCNPAKLPQSKNPQPTKIDETRDVVGPLDKTWSWRVDNFSYRTFRIRVDMEGAAGGPQFANVGNYGFKLNAGECSGTKLSQGGGGLTVNSGGKVNLLDRSFSGVQGYGNWSMELKAGIAAVRYHVQVTVEY